MADPGAPRQGDDPAPVDDGPRDTAGVVGRAVEVERILDWWAVAGPAILVIEGAPGLGKTTVWTSAIEALRERSIRVLRGAPVEAESGLSYSGLADLLTGDFEAVRSELPAPQVRALAVALRIEEPGDRPVDATAIARGTLDALRAIARRHGGRVLVAIDDLRWLDAPSLATVMYAARRLDPSDGVRILTTHRTGEAIPVGLDRVPDVEWLALGPLSVGAIHRIVRLATGVTLPRPRLLEIHALTLGNPLHAIELVRSTGAAGFGTDGSLAGLYAARVASLPRRSRAALTLLAASADRSGRRLAAAWAMGIDGGPGGEYRAAIEPAVAAELVTVEGDRIQPVHPLVAHVADASADPVLRRAAHRALAATARDDEERAFHLGRSVDGPDASVADVIEAAARQVRARGVRAVSAAMYERSAALTPPGDGSGAARRWLAAASAWYAAGDTHHVERLLEPLIGAWARGTARAEARWRLGVALDEGGRWAEATTLWRTALDDTDDLALRSQIRCSLAITALYTESLASALEYASCAVDDAERSSDPPALARSLAVHAFILTMAGRPDGEALMDRALAIETGIDEPLGEWSPAAQAAEVARHRGDIAGALRQYAVVLDRASAHGDANMEQWAAFGLASAAIVAGQLERASVLADLVYDIAEQTDVMRIPARTLRAHVDAYRGDIERSRTLIEESLALARADEEATHQFSAYVVIGAIETCAGDAAAAARAYLEARTLATRLGLAHAAVPRTYLAEVEAAAASGELEQAAAALAAFEAVVSAPSPSWTAPLHRRALAACLAARGETAAAIVELDLAVADEACLPPDAARARLALASVLRRERRYREARRAAEAARTAFAELGMAALSAAADRELARIPGRRTGGDGELSAAEMRIASLVAAGRSNRDVAEELVLSVKTVEVTLTRVYGKLGVRSRSELAARFRPDSKV